MFELYHIKQADPPDTNKIPAEDAVGVTVVLITATYRDQEFVRIGYYVNNDYEESELKDNPPIEPVFTKLIRTIAFDQPRVTKFKINWDSETNSTSGTTAAETGSDTSVKQPINETASERNPESEMVCEDLEVEHKDLPLI